MPRFITFLSFLLISLTTPCLATASTNKTSRPRKLNAIDQCWRANPRWLANRQKLAACSVGFAGKMTNNVGPGLTRYVVTDSSDDPINPKPGTLRYGATILEGKVWITFKCDTTISLKRKLMVSSFTTIDGRGAHVHIAGGSGMVLMNVSNVIIHGINFHDIKSKSAGQVIAPGSKIMMMPRTDGDAIRLVGSSKVWIDHNTLYNANDGLIDVTLGSTDVTISNNLFKNHDKVMLLGHNDANVEDKNMRVTIVLNRFGPNCIQRMPRIRHGYAHIANNFYRYWGNYAIGGSTKSTVRSESNVFIALRSGNKKVTWAHHKKGDGKSWNWRSVNDLFRNGAYFRQRGKDPALPHYTDEQTFSIVEARQVKSLTASAGAL